MNRTTMLILTGALFVPLVTGYTCFGPPGTVACGTSQGFVPSMLDSVAHCPPAVERLGSGAHFAMLGVGCGNFEQGRLAGDGHAYGKLPIEGTKGHASLTYSLTRAGDRWSPSQLLMLFDDGSKIDVKACAQPYDSAKDVEAGFANLQAACDAGQAGQCHALALIFQAKGDTAASAKAAAQACALGLAAACPAKKP